MDAPLLPAVVAALPTPIAAAGRDSTILAANAAWHRLARAAQPASGALDPGSLDAVFPAASGAVEAVLRSAGPVTRQKLPLAADPSGMVTWWDLDLVPHPEAQAVVLVTARDVTEQVLARREAEDFRETIEPVDVRLRHAQEAAGIGTWEWEAEADRQVWSAQQFRLHGLDPAVDVPPSLTEWLAMVHPDDRAAIAEAMDSGFSDGLDTGYQMEFRIVRRDTGAERRMISLGRVLARASDGRIARVVGVNLDVTAMAARTAETLEARAAGRGRTLTEAAVALQAEMRRRQDRQSAPLESQKLEALGQMTAGVAHDFNNVLAVIQSSFELIEKRTRIPRVLQLVDIGQQAIETATALTRQLLDLGRPAPLKPAVLAVGEVVRRTHALIAPAVAGTIVHDLDIAADIWPVRADPHQLELALLNLAINARDAMPDGGTLTVAARNLPPEPPPPSLPAGDYVAISVSDSGHGMPPEVAARATEPFFTTKSAGKGTGLGLAMVHSFARRSGGCLQIDSRINEGTTVRIVLPRAQVAVIAPAQPDPGADRFPRAAQTVLVVDDDEQVRQIAADILRDQGHIVIEAPDAEAAIVLSHSFQRLDMLVTDLMLSGADGTALAARLRAERPDLPVLFMTGLGERDDLAGEAVLTKPFTGIALARAVARWIGGGSQTGMAAEAPDDGLVRRLRNPSLLAAYLFWRAARRGNRLPRLPDLDWNGQPDAEHSFVVAVEPAGNGVQFRFLRVGRALRARLSRSIENTTIPANPDGNPIGDPDDEVLGSLAAAYRRCSRTSQPSYEYASYDFGDGAPGLFERLILPVADDGEQVTHLVGIALFSSEL